MIIADLRAAGLLLCSSEVLQSRNCMSRSLRFSGNFRHGVEIRPASRWKPGLIFAAILPPLCCVWLARAGGPSPELPITIAGFVLAACVFLADFAVHNPGIAYVLSPAGTLAVFSSRVGDNDSSSTIRSESTGSAPSLGSPVSDPSCDTGVERSSPRRICAAPVIAEMGIFLALLGVALLLQWAGGAYSSEMGHYPDEAGHYITGLMVRDYAAAGFPGNPVTFAERFYVRFPKVTFGYWPPLFHLIMGVWLLPTPDGRASALLLMALIMASAGYVLYRCVRQVAGWACGVPVSLLLVLLSISQVLTNAIMADSLVMLMELATAVRIAKWLRTGSNRDALWLGVFAGLSCMAKGNAVAVVFAIPVAIALTRRFDLLRKSEIYAAGLIAVVLSFYWQLQSLSLGRRVSAFSPFSFGAARQSLVFSLEFLYHTLGWVLCAVITLGVILAAGSIRRRVGAWDLWAAMSAVGFSVFVFHIVLPHVVEGRFLLAGIAPLMVFLVPGAGKIASILPLAKVTARWRVPLVLSCILAIFLGLFFQVSKMPRFGFREAAEWLENHPLAGRRYLIISDSSGEGGFISEVASRADRRLSGPFVMRVSKLLVISDWLGNGYRLVYTDPEKALADVEQMGISYIVMDSTHDLEQGAHWEQARRMLNEYPGRLKLVHQFPAGENGHVRSLDIYQVLHFANPPSRKFEFQMIYTRGGSIRE